MRKHFLLLFLMALLPLAGSAENIKAEWFSVLNVVYGTASAVTTTASAPQSNFNAESEYTVDSKIYKLVDGEYVELEASDRSKSGNPKAGKTYYRKITGIGTYSADVYKPFEVTKKEVTVKFKGAEWTYGTPKPAKNVIYALATSDPFTGLVTGDYTDGTSNTTDTRAQVFKNAKYGETGQEKDVKRNASTAAVEGYAYSAESNDENYTIKVDASTTFTIKPADLPAYSTTLYTFTVPANAKYVYNGSDMTNLPTISVKTAANAAALTPGTDYEVVWYNSNESTSGSDASYKTVNKETPKVAAKEGTAVVYYAQVEGKGNYKGAVNSKSESTAAKQWKMSVEKKDLMIYVQPFPKVYDGTAIAVDNSVNNAPNITGANIIVTTWATADDKTNLASQIKAKFSKGDGSDTEITDAMVSAWNTTATAPKDYRAMGYPMVAYYVEPTSGARLTDNYKPQFLEIGILTIQQREVKVTALEQKKTYTGGVLDFNHTIVLDGDNKTVTIEAATYDNTTVPATLTSTTGLLDGESLTEDNKVYFSIVKNAEVTEEFKAAKKYEKAITIKATEYAEGKNYKIVPVAANFVIEGRALTVIANTPADKEYGYILNKEDLNYVTNAGALELKHEPTYTVTDKDNVPYTVDGTTVLPRGTYTITITPDETLAPNGYTLAADAYYPGTLTVGPATLKAKVKNQTVALNTNVASGANNKLQQGKEYVEFEGLVGNEVVKYEIYSTQPTANADTYNGVITVKLVDPSNTETQYSNANYKVLADADITKGNLKVLPANTIILDRDELDLVNFIKTNKSTTATDKKTIAFSNRSLADEAWNSFVLPFEVKVSELSNAVDYCLVNVLDKDASKVVDGKAQVRFKIEMNRIPANTPFLMKTADAKNMSDVTLPNVILVEAATTPVVNTDGDIEFIPVYAKTVMKENNRFPVNATETVKWKYGNDEEAEADQVRLRALASYIQVPVGVQARIFVEDFENGSTAIKEIGVDGTTKAYAVDGWYTLNGVKLQGAPTEKGIYINNGKKVVVK